MTGEDDDDIEVFVCLNVDCKSRGAQELLDRLNDRVEEAGLDQVVPEPYLCFSACQHGPNVVIPSRRCWLSGVSADDVDEVVAFLRQDATNTVTVVTTPYEPPAKKQKTDAFINDDDSD